MNTYIYMCIYIYMYGSFCVSIRGLRVEGPLRLVSRLHVSDDKTESATRDSLKPDSSNQGTLVLLNKDDIEGFSKGSFMAP